LVEPKPNASGHPFVVELGEDESAGEHLVSRCRDGKRDDAVRYHDVEELVGILDERGTRDILDVRAIICVGDHRDRCRIPWL